MQILVVDDHPLVRAGVREVLKGLDADVKVIEAANAALALEQVAANPGLDLALIDLNLPDMNGLELLAKLGARTPDLPVVVLSGAEDPALMRLALERGALGFVPKTALSDIIVPALRLVLSGGVYMPPQMLTGASGRPALGITPRQGEVLQLMLDGKSNKEIARALELSEPTVKAHMTAILRAFNVRTRAQAMVAAARYGFRSADSSL
jgi:DNA-binding NarL/FixJ family response regulator